MKSRFGFFIVLSFILSACYTRPDPTPTPTMTPTAVLPTNTPAPTSTPTPTPFRPIPHLDIFFAEQDILRDTRYASGFHGIYIHEIGSPDYVVFNEDLALHGASTVKIAIGVVVLKVTQDNSIDILSEVPYDQIDNLAVSLQKMLVNHDEQATTALINYVNSLGYRFDDVLTGMGIEGFNINHRLTTARSLGLIYENLATNAWSLDQNAYLLNLLSQNSGKDKGELPWTINELLPGQYDNLAGAIYDAEIPVSRLGMIRYVAADTGIWTTPDGHQFVIVLIGNYDSERGFHTENSFIRSIATILSELE